MSSVAHKASPHSARIGPAVMKLHESWPALSLELGQRGRGEVMESAGGGVECDTYELTPLGPGNDLDGDLQRKGARGDGIPDEKWNSIRIAMRIENTQQSLIEQQGQIYIQRQIASAEGEPNEEMEKRRGIRRLLLTATTTIDASYLTRHLKCLPADRRSSLVDLTWLAAREARPTTPRLVSSIRLAATFARDSLAHWLTGYGVYEIVLGLVRPSEGVNIRKSTFPSGSSSSIAGFMHLKHGTRSTGV
ncbi:hypothetical protein C8R45DRAFT_1073897 [Mycena sanguinolenta]|nr:hypothetical protein C8R45DRAFT_1073897 [Mycena sanguinolenta]